MQKKVLLRQSPRYPIESVDHALILLEMVRDHGRIRLGVAAELLGVSASTAHRLLAMLVYRGYVTQDPSRRYVPGPAMGLPPAGAPWTTELRHRAVPHLEMLVGAVDESTNLVVRAGTEVRFLTTVEGSRTTRVGGRQGVSLPARRASGGKALLAELDPQHVERLYRRHADLHGRPFDPQEHSRLAAELALVRDRGLALNDEQTEPGVSAAGIAIRDGSGTAIAAMTVAVPRERFRSALDAGLIDSIQAARTEIEADLHDFTAATW